MKTVFLATIVAMSVLGSVSTSFARGTDDGAAIDLTGKKQDVIQKRGGADDGFDRRGPGQDVLLKRNGADDGFDRRGHGQDVLLKRQGADDPVNHIRRGRGADDGLNHMRDARGHR